MSSEHRENTSQHPGHTDRLANWLVRHCDKSQPTGIRIRKGFLRLFDATYQPEVYAEVADTLAANHDIDIEIHSFAEIVVFPKPRVSFAPRAIGPPVLSRHFYDHAFLSRADETGTVVSGRAGLSHAAQIYPPPEVTPDYV